MDKDVYKRAYVILSDFLRLTGSEKQITRKVQQWLIGNEHTQEKEIAVYRIFCRIMDNKEPETADPEVNE